MIRPDEVVPAIGEIQYGTPHSVKYGLFKDKLISWASFTHPMYREENATIYYWLEEYIRTTPYAASINTFQRAKNGQVAWLDINYHFEGRYQWESEMRQHEQLIRTQLWKGQSNFTLEKFIAQHRNAFVSMQDAAEHVTYQLTNEHRRVGYLLDSIQNSNSGL